MQTKRHDFTLYLFLRSDESAALMRMRRTLEGALKCAFRDLRLELLTPAHKSRLLKTPQTLQKTPTLHTKAIKNQTATQKSTHRHPPLATAVEETKPNQTKNKKEKKAKARKKKSAWKVKMEKTITWRELHGCWYRERWRRRERREAAAPAPGAVQVKREQQTSPPLNFRVSQNATKP